MRIQVWYVNIAGPHYSYIWKLKEYLDVSYFWACRILYGPLDFLDYFLLEGGNYTVLQMERLCTSCLAADACLARLTIWSTSKLSVLRSAWMIMSSTTCHVIMPSDHVKWSCHPAGKGKAFAPSRVCMLCMCAHKTVLFIVGKQHRLVRWFFKEKEKRENQC